MQRLENLNQQVKQATKIPEHPIYKQVPIEQADAVAWVLSSKTSDLQQYPFKVNKKYQ